MLQSNGHNPVINNRIVVRNQSKTNEQTIKCLVKIYTCFLNQEKQKKKYASTGYLITQDVVCTVAHGIYINKDDKKSYYKPTEIIIKTIGGEQIKVKEYKIFDQYFQRYTKPKLQDQNIASNDIALLRLQRPVGISIPLKIEPINQKNLASSQIYGYPVNSQKCTNMDNYSTQNDGFSGAPILINNKYYGHYTGVRKNLKQGTITKLGMQYTNYVIDNFITPFLRQKSSLVYQFKTQANRYGNFKDKFTAERNKQKSGQSVQFVSMSPLYKSVKFQVLKYSTQQKARIILGIQTETNTHHKSNGSTGIKYKDRGCISLSSSIYTKQAKILICGERQKCEKDILLNIKDKVEFLLSKQQKQLKLKINDKTIHIINLTGFSQFLQNRLYPFVALRCDGDSAKIINQ